mmetsp:Transcript_24580/g.80310  ORF Transcript_24580/g.80310 Transcript_24580/m.80310 type:complete len:208 (+) Transcript_24580:3143-3766(+)
MFANPSFPVCLSPAATAAAPMLLSMPSFTLPHMFGFLPETGRCPSAGPPPSPESLTPAKKPTLCSGCVSETRGSCWYCCCCWNGVSSGMIPSRALAPPTLCCDILPVLTPSSCITAAKIAASPLGRGCVRTPSGAAAGAAGAAVVGGDVASSCRPRQPRKNRDCCREARLRTKRSCAWWCPRCLPDRHRESLRADPRAKATCASPLR